ncbi:hypothetical protein [Rhodococcus koreensis]|uniref:DUF3263 domain-containing protein n=1 Tax=Rhodococcus koreensis TaxID=99653 RepID=A0A1H4XAH0_9NOCA|nr:hypothetical protein [Rhodococcus koreensis]SED02200.1 hypothetical protein SAMN04490239_6444 [Rhodococcus koreensis]
MTREEEQLLRLAVIWRPYGGPPEETVFERFGVGRSTFDERVKALARRLAVR